MTEEDEDEERGRHHRLKLFDLSSRYDAHGGWVDNSKSRSSPCTRAAILSP